MATRNVQFNFAANPSPPSPAVAATDHLVLTVTDPLSNVVYTSPSLAPSTTTLTVPLPTQQSYAAWIRAYSSAGTVNVNVPHQEFAVPDLPAPVAPGDPTIGVPVLL